MAGKAERRTRQVLELLFHPLKWIRYIRGIFAAYRNATANLNALNCFKYLGVYLAADLLPEQRRKAILFHHAFLASALQTTPWSTDFSILTKQYDAEEIEIVLRAAELSPMEGEHELAFLYEGQTIYTLTFIIVAGETVGLPAPAVMVIGGLQGAYLARDKMRIAAKLNGEIAPVALLLLAATALAETLGVMRLVGVGSRNHSAMNYAAHAIVVDYDRLWLKFGALRERKGWVRLYPGAKTKPLAEVSRSHRNRTRRKRELKALLYNEMLATARISLLRC